jgi:hypothetical protein
MDENEFWLPKPKLWDFQTVAILIPVIASAIGLFLMSVEAMVFAQFESLPNDVRLWVSIISAFFMAFGSEIGTVSTNTFIFSRLAKCNTRFYAEWDRVTKWDYAGLIVSWLGTTVSMFIASATRPNTFTDWQSFIANWLVLPLMILAVSDAIFGIIELGTAIGQFDMRMVYWVGRKREWQDDESRKKLLEESLGITLKDTKPMKPIQIKKTLHCWCGKELQNERAYNAHLRIHKNEVKTYSDAQQALEALKEKYTFENASFDFPKLSDIVEWRN